MQSKRTWYALVTALGMMLPISAVWNGAALAQTVPAANPCPDTEALLVKTRTDANTASGFINLGNAYLCSAARGNSRELLAAARDAFETAIRLEPRNAIARYGLGSALFELGDYDAALSEYDQLTKLDDKNPTPFYNMGLIYAKLRKTDEAIKAFSKAAELGKAAKSSGDFQRNILTALAQQQNIKKEYPAAAASYKAAQEFAPKDSSLKVSEAQARFDAQQYFEALEVSREVLKTEPNNTGAVLIIASIYERTNQLERAARELNSSLTQITDPKDRSKLLVRRATIERKLGRTNDALKTLSDAVSSDLGSFEARIEYGNAILRMPKPDAQLALLQFMEARKLRPDSGEALFGAARAYDALGNYQSAYNSAKAASRQLTDSARANEAAFLAGRSAYYIGKFRDAITEFRALLGKDAKNPRYQYWMGLCFIQTEDYAAAVDLLYQTVTAQPNNVDARVALSAAYIGAKRFSDAEIVARSVVKVAPRNAEAWYNLGLALLNQSKLEEGRRALKTAAQLGNRAAQQTLSQLGNK
jgi:tetratricopeptide (TPR) repeat protein